MQNQAWHGPAPVCTQAPLHSSLARSSKTNSKCRCPQLSLKVLAAAVQRSRAMKCSPASPGTPVEGRSAAGQDAPLASWLGFLPQRLPGAFSEPLQAYPTAGHAGLVYAAGWAEPVTAAQVLLGLLKQPGCQLGAAELHLRRQFVTLQLFAATQLTYANAAEILETGGASRRRPGASQA